MATRKLTSLQARFHHGSQGTPIAVHFVCPSCAPTGACEVKMEWGERPPGAGEEFATLNHLSFGSDQIKFPGGAPACQFKGFVKDGVVNW